MSTSGRQTSSGGSLARSGSTAVVRGALLVGVAFILGVVLLGKAFSEGELNPISDRTGTSTPGDTIVDPGDEPGAGGNGGETTSTTLPPPTTHVRSAVTVLVLNGSGVKGIAQTGTDAVKAQGFVTADPTNSKERVAATVVYFTTEEFRPDALAVAAHLRVSELQVLAIPNPPPVADIKGAQVVVVLGPDASIPG